MPEKIIKHTGFITSVSDQVIEASVVVSSACSGCHASGACGVSDSSSRTITIEQFQGSYKVGDFVNIVGAQSIGMSAVLFAYVLPFIAVLITLIVSLQLGASDLKAGVFSLLVLPPYYLIIYLFKGRFEKKYTFRIV